MSSEFVPNLRCERAQINGASFLQRYFVEGDHQYENEPVEIEAIDHLKSCKIDSICKEGERLVKQYWYFRTGMDETLRYMLDNELVSWQNKISRKVQQNGN